MGTTDTPLKPFINQNARGTDIGENVSGYNDDTHKRTTSPKYQKNVPISSENNADSSFITELYGFPLIKAREDIKK